MLFCNNCELHYEVIFNNDALAVDGDRPDQFCPRCGGCDLDSDDGEITQAAEAGKGE
jgi:hypothetical protein